MPIASLVLPAYNERNRIGACLAEVARWTREKPEGFTWEVLLVDDGSRDGTPGLAQESAAAAGIPVTVLSHPVNRGKGAALRTGVAASRGEIVLLSDVDLSTPLSELSKLAPMLATHPVAIGSRAIDVGLVRRRQPWHRILLGRAGNKIIRALAVSGIADTQCGFKLFRGDLARELFAAATIERFAYDVEILYLAQRRGIPIAEVPVLWFNSPES
ncbi:MAG TPA: dolichyl-phosphate beta-glucosyltransferase, partial [Thermoanaerobaculia bacterium]